MAEFGSSGKVYHKILFVRINDISRIASQIKTDKDTIYLPVVALLLRRIVTIASSEEGSSKSSSDCMIIVVCWQSSNDDDQRIRQIESTGCFITV